MEIYKTLSEQPCHLSLWGRKWATSVERHDKPIGGEIGEINVVKER